MIACPKQRVGMLLSACLVVPSALCAFSSCRITGNQFWWSRFQWDWKTSFSPFQSEESFGCWRSGRRGSVSGCGSVRDSCSRAFSPVLYPAILLDLALWRGGLSVMTSVVLSMVALAIVLLWLRPWFLAIALMGAMGFSLFYFLFARAALAIWPPGHWNVGKLWGYWFFRVPLEEIVWAVAYGFVWPLVMAYVFNAELVPVPGELAPTAQEAIRGK